MKEIRVPVPDSLYERIEAKAKTIDRTVGELVSLWLWDIEEQKRNADQRCGAGGIAGSHHRCVSAGHDDGSIGGGGVAEEKQGGD
jgi:hypothetical protein